MKLALTVATLATLLALSACSSSDDDSNDDDTTDPGVTDPDATASPATLNLTFAGLDDLGDDFVYEGWLLVNGAPVSTGRFDAAESDVQSATVENAEAATAYVLTIEPAVDDPPEPAATHVLAGDIIDNASTLTIAHPDAVGTDFVDSSGSFIIDTPSSAAEDDYDLGIWWLAMPGPVAGLTLPALPDGWLYEGWVAGPDGPVSTGTFSEASGADSDIGGPTAGPEGTPPFPGQDFITPPVSVVGLSAVISVEPDPDNSPVPFGIKPLIDDNIEDVGRGGSQDMANTIADNQPSGTLTIVLPAAE